jgi:hypothetical protein
LGGNRANFEISFKGRAAAIAETENRREQAIACERSKTKEKVKHGDAVARGEADGVCA